MQLVNILDLFIYSTPLINDEESPVEKITDTRWDSETPKLVKKIIELNLYPTRINGKFIPAVYIYKYFKKCYCSTAGIGENGSYDSIFEVFTFQPITL